MKPFLILALLVLNTMAMNGQTNVFDKPQEGTYQNTYTSPDWSAVISTLEKTKRSKQEKELWDKSVALYESGDYIKSVQVFSIMMEKMPDYYEAALILRGKSYMNLWNFGKADKDFTELINTGRSLRVAYLNRSVIRYYGKQYSQSIQDCNSLLRLSNLPSDSISALLYRGLSKSNLKDKYGARMDYNRILQIDSTDTYALNNLAWMKYEEGNYSEALTLVNKSLKSDPTHLNAINTRAEIYLNQKLYSLCIEDVTTAIRIAPNGSYAYILRAKANLAKGEKEKACQDFSLAGEKGSTEAYKLIAIHCQ